MSHGAFSDPYCYSGTRVLGSQADWVATGLSDHVPVVVEFAMT